MTQKIESITKQLLEEIGEDPNREGLTKTPYRVSFFGGGSDYPEWYSKYGGEVISSTINNANKIFYGSLSLEERKAVSLTIILQANFEKISQNVLGKIDINLSSSILLAIKLSSLMDA